MVSVQSKEGTSNYGCRDVGYCERGSQIKVSLDYCYNFLIKYELAFIETDYKIYIRLYCLSISIILAYVCLIIFSIKK